MAIRPVLTYPQSPVLRQKATPVKTIDDTIRALLRDMADTMYDAPGIGLAAPQIGESLRVIVVDVGDDEETGKTGRLYKIVNPEIKKAEGKTDSEEGCLSIPEIRETISRYTNVIVEGYDENEKPLTIEAGGLLAICLQHEIDHLNGILFIDHLSRVKRNLIESRIKKQTRE